MREWQCVTVALAASSSCASGLPTRIERPITTARAPSSAAPASLSSSITPAGVHGDHRLRAPLHQQPGVDGREAVDVLGRVDQRDELVLVEVVGQRELQQDAVDALVGVQVAQQPGELVGRASAPSSWWNDSMPTSAESSRFMRT